MDARLALASKRDVREYADTAVPVDVVVRILDAGRLSGSSRNTQQWEFVVVDSKRPELAEAVYAPANVLGATLVVAIVGAAGGMDVGRCAQNMMLAAWAEGVASCPNGIKDPAAAAAICGGEVKTILSFGYPARLRGPQSRTARSGARGRTASRSTSSSAASDTSRTPTSGARHLTCPRPSRPVPGT